MHVDHALATEAPCTPGNRASVVAIGRRDDCHVIYEVRVALLVNVIQADGGIT